MLAKITVLNGILNNMPLARSFSPQYHILTNTSSKINTITDQKRQKKSPKTKNKSSSSAHVCPTVLHSLPIKLHAWVQAACPILWHMRTLCGKEKSLPVLFLTLRFTCEYPACIRWLWVGEPRAKLWLHAQLCRRTVFTKAPRGPHNLS